MTRRCAGPPFWQMSSRHVRVPTFPVVGSKAGTFVYEQNSWRGRAGQSTFVIRTAPLMALPRCPQSASFHMKNENVPLCIYRCFSPKCLLETTQEITDISSVRLHPSHFVAALPQTSSRRDRPKLLGPRLHLVWGTWSPCCDFEEEICREIAMARCDNFAGPVHARCITSRSGQAPQPGQGRRGEMLSQSLFQG